MSTIAKMRSSLHSALERIGYRNSHICPESKSNVDPLLHELFVSHEGLSHFDKRRKVAISAAIKAAGQGAADAVAPGTEQAILDGVSYSLVIKKNNPAERIDRTKINNALHKRGFTEAEVLKFMADVSVSTKPATSVRAVPKT